MRRERNRRLTAKPVVRSAFYSVIAQKRKVMLNRKQVMFAFRLLIHSVAGNC